MARYLSYIIRCSIALVLFLFPIGIFAQENSAAELKPKKYALVIGNGDYTGLSHLANPSNDASDVTVVLEHLGFTVEKHLSRGKIICEIIHSDNKIF